jgi:hypothetical protein
MQISKRSVDFAYTYIVESAYTRVRSLIEATIEAPLMAERSLDGWVAAFGLQYNCSRWAFGAL